VLVKRPDEVTWTAEAWCTARLLAHHPGRAADGRMQAQHDADDRDATAVRLRDAGHENMDIL
jgi:hypothetical protein